MTIEVCHRGGDVATYDLDVRPLPVLGSRRYASTLKAAASIPSRCSLV